MDELLKISKFVAVECRASKGGGSGKTGKGQKLGLRNIAKNANGMYSPKQVAAAKAGIKYASTIRTTGAGRQKALSNALKGANLPYWSGKV